MECPNCHEQIPDSSKFCLKCGAIIEQIVNKCSYCGFEGLPADAEFCPRCGNRLENVKNENSEIALAMEEMKMVLVEGGTFSMGAGGIYIFSDESPVHSVTLSDYYISRHPVTQQQWQMIMEGNPSRFKGDNRPVEKVSWYDCVNYCNELSLKYGMKECYQIHGTSVSLLNGGKGGFRLPTESEWEFAARGGNKSLGFKYAGSDNLNEVTRRGIFVYNTDVVCHKKPNELGLYDMSGNVWEWCWDWYGRYPSSSQSNPLGPSSGSNRVHRGGSWDNDASLCRVSYRRYDTPDDRDGDLGLRLVLAL